MNERICMCMVGFIVYFIMPLLCQNDLITFYFHKLAILIGRKEGRNDVSVCNVKQVNQYKKHLFAQGGCL